MKNINIHEAKTSLSKVLSTIEEEKESYVICRNGKPVADLIPHKSKSRISQDSLLSKITIDFDPTEDLTEDEWGEVE